MGVALLPGPQSTQPGPSPPAGRRSGGRSRSGPDRRWPAAAPSGRRETEELAAAPRSGSLAASRLDRPSASPLNPTCECGGRQRDDQLRLRPRSSGPGLPGPASRYRRQRPASGRSARRAPTPQDWPETRQKPSETRRFRPILAGFQPRPGRHDRSFPVPGGSANAQFGFFPECFKPHSNRDL